MFSSLVAERVRVRLQQVGVVIARTGLSPNQLTVLGLLLNGVVCCVAAFGLLQLAGVLLLVASLFDLLDGAVARATGRITRFGGVLDSVLDRYAEAFVVGGILIWTVRSGQDALSVLLCYVVIVGSILVSYVRARAEATGVPLRQGWVTRPERIAVLALGLLIGRPLWALAPLALVAHLTVFQRLWLVRQATRDEN